MHCWIEPTCAKACLLTVHWDELTGLVSRAEADCVHFPVRPSTLGLLPAVVGNVDRALERLEKAHLVRDPAMVFQPKAPARIIVMPEVEKTVN